MRHRLLSIDNDRRQKLISDSVSRPVAAANRLLAPGSPTAARRRGSV